MIVGNVPAMGNNLRNLRLGKNWSQQEAADRLNMSKSGYLKKERGERKLDDDFAAKAATVYGVPISVVMDGPNVVKMIGYVGAGHAMHFYGDADDLNEEVSAPPEVTERTVAVQVRGDSMADHIENGAILYYDDRRDPPTDDIIGKLCVVGVSDGRVLVKKLARGSRQGLWHLLSANAAPMFDQPVSWAARVTWIKPT